MAKTDTASPTKAAPKSKKTGAPAGGARQRPGAVTAGLALILACLAFLIGIYLWYSLTLRQGLFTSEASNRVSELEREAAQLRESLPALEQQLDALQETQDTLKAGVEKIYSDLGKGRSDWVLTETEQLLTIANNHLQLAREVSLALAALRAADKQLKDLANPALLPVRKILIEEIGALEALARTDISGMALRLGAMAARIERLPLATLTHYSEAAAGTADSGGRALPREMWKDLMNLIRIRGHGEARKPLLPPDQQYFARENLRLMLYGAQLALLRGDAATFEQNTTSAKQWLSDYYDTSSQVVIAAQDELDGLLKARIKTALPDISRSLEALRRITGRRGGS
jgi:uncharacterized protein HemX